jgi:hypothetical protein
MDGIRRTEGCCSGRNSLLFDTPAQITRKNCNTRNIAGMTDDISPNNQFLDLKLFLVGGKQARILMDEEAEQTLNLAVKQNEGKTKLTFEIPLMDCSIYV